ncbi:hypothetical protein PACTADRAFT_37429 [Pachysolen tannophilus NRRL Y-2460]|uniref:N-acetyltransferase domain-containing protein n=1 Tax=Pachysolen tannophilus NRRL Y-2460 TaxID=669874 RepID=A0A1E4U0U4_PACTA|nr:hypothetical protein PACTADRAFT_37429 [Pachysolen tannophilus NRRL Y-2460]
MTSIVPFQATDLFTLNAINLDSLTENFQVFFYLQYLSDWPSLFFKSESPILFNNELLTTPSGYMMGKNEGHSKEWHTHITAVTISPTYRRLGLASHLCNHLQKSTEEEEPYYTYFIDLFVRCNNKLAITLYEKLGYSIYRRVVGYYSSSSGNINYEIDKNKTNDDVDAFDMRKSLKRDVNHECVRENGEKFNVLPEEVRF